MIKSFFTSVIILFCVVLVETAVLSNITALPAVPDLALLCVLYISMLNGKTFGTVCGFASGLLLDFISGAPLGFNCLFRTLLGYIAGGAGKSFNYGGIVVPAAAGFSGTLAKALCVWLISLFYPAVTVRYDIASGAFLFELALNSVLAPVMFQLLRFFRRPLAAGREERF